MIASTRILAAVICVALVVPAAALAGTVTFDFEPLPDRGVETAAFLCRAPAFDLLVSGDGVALNLRSGTRAAPAQRVFLRVLAANGSPRVEGGCPATVGS